MTSTPEDGEIRRHSQGEDESKAARTSESWTVKEVENHDAAILANREGQDDELPQLGLEEFRDEERRADSIDEADTIPETAESTRLDLRSNDGPKSPSLDGSASIPDDTPSAQNSGISSPHSDALSSQPSLAVPSAPPPRRPFDLRFQSRLSSSPLASPRASSPAFLHSRQSSLVSLGVQSTSEPDSSTAPWEIIRWTRLGKLTNQTFSELGRRNFGSPTCLAVTDNIVVGTSRGLVLVFDHQQSIKGIFGTGTQAVECGPVSSLALSADHSTIAAGHALGHIFTWEITRPSKPFLHIPPVDNGQPEARKGDGHIVGSSVLHVGFLGFRRTALVSADDRGMAFSHLATRGTGSLGRTVKTTRVLGRYPDAIQRPNKPTKKSSVLAFSPLPLGNVEQRTDSLGLVAMMTPYLLVIVSTTPIAQTQHKAARPKEVSAHGAMTAALAWFPAIKLKGSDTATSRSKLVYVWSDVLTVLEIHELVPESEIEKEKPVELQFLPRSRYKADEAIVAVQWLSRSVMAVLTITQQLLIIEDVTMTVTDSFDLLPKNIYHIDAYSQQLRTVIESFDEEDSSLHGVVADAFHMSFRTYKGKLFLLGFKTVWWGSLTNWADRLLALMDAVDFIGAIRLATSYYLGSGEKLTIGLPEDQEQRAKLIREKLIEMMIASLKYAFGRNQIAGTGPLDKSQLTDLAVACISASLTLDDQDFLFEEVFPWYDDHDDGSIFVDVLEPYILDGKVDSLPPPVIKTLINHFKTTHSASSLEEIICLLDPTTMDIDQVTSLCKRNNLFDAYIYVWNTALRDYVSPLKELLDMIPTSSKVNGHVATGLDTASNARKIFTYLSFILTGRVYPTGLFLDEDTSNVAKLQLYDFLFSGTHFDALREADSSTSYPNLRVVLAYDASSFMSALNEAFEDSFLNDDEVMNGTGNDYSHVKIYTRQYIVQILLAVMSTGFEAKDSIYLDMFIGRNLPKYPQYMLLSGSDLQDTFMRLCHYDDEGLRDDAQLSVEYLLTAYHPLEILKLVPVLRRAQFYRVLKSVFRQERQYADLVDTFFLDPNGRQGVFEVIMAYLREASSLDADEKSEVKQVVQNHVLELVDIDVSRTALTIEAVSPDLHSTFIDGIADDARLQFSYLRALIEPVAQSSNAKANIGSGMLELYIRLMCLYDRKHVATYIKTMKETDLKLDAVVPAMESSGAIDAAVILMTQQGQVRAAMDRLVKHIDALESALRGFIQTLSDNPDNDGTNETIEDLLQSIEQYTSVGIWICQGLKLKSVAKSPKRMPAQQPLGFEETIWVDLIICVVSVAQESKPGMMGTAEIDDQIQSSLRNVIQKVFTELLSTTTSSREGSRTGSDYTFLRILRGFLTRAAETAPTLSELRSVISSIFSAYAYEESLLAISNAMLDKDLFIHVDEVAQLRRRGWRPRGQICEICRRRVWGPGTGLQQWDAWQDSEIRRQERRMTIQSALPGSEVDSPSSGKGKSAALTATTATEASVRASHEGNDHGGSAECIVVFLCRHIYHRSCLLQNEQQDGGGEQDTRQSVSEGQQRAADNVQLRCPSCP